MSPAELSSGTGNELNWPGFTFYWLQKLIVSQLLGHIFCLGFSSLKGELLGDTRAACPAPLSPFPAPSHTLALPSTRTAGWGRRHGSSFGNRWTR